MSEIILWNPKYPHNVGAAVRAASCFGVKKLWFSGNRVSMTAYEGYRLPREERMKAYKDVELIQHDYPFDHIDASVVAIELRENAEILTYFEHPDNAVYVFGPEDGSLPGVVLRHCHRVVKIPIRHCANLAAAVYMTLYDRMLKRTLSGAEQLLELAEHRGFIDDGLELANRIGLR